MAKFEFNIPTLKGYYYDSVDGNIYSTKRGKIPYQIKWAKRAPWAPKTAQLFTTDGEKFLLDERRLKGMLKGNPMDSVIFKHPETEDLFNQKPHVDVKKPFSTKETYIVIAIENGRLAPAKEPKAHCTLAAARAEAERLARLAPSTQFRVYKDCGTVQSTGVIWE